MNVIFRMWTKGKAAYFEETRTLPYDTSELEMDMLWEEWIYEFIEGGVEIKEEERE